MCCHGELKLPQGDGWEGEEVWSFVVPAVHSSSAAGTVESIPSNVSYMLDISWQANHHFPLFFFVVVVSFVIELKHVGQVLEALEHLVDSCRNVGLWKRRFHLPIRVEEY